MESNQQVPQPPKRPTPDPEETLQEEPQPKRQRTEGPDASLATLPPEIWHRIIPHVPLYAVRNLIQARLTVAQQAAEAAQRKLFRNHTFFWDSWFDIWRLEMTTDSPLVRKHLEELVISGSRRHRCGDPNCGLCKIRHAHSSGRDPYDVDLSVRLLAGALESILKDYPNRTLEVTLRMLPPPSRHPNPPMRQADTEFLGRRVLTHASQTLRTALRAFADAGMGMRSLDAFTPYDGFSLPIDSIGTLLDERDYSLVLRPVRRLALRLSRSIMQTWDPTQPPPDPYFEVPIGRHHVNGVQRLIDMCEDLNTLDLHWYATKNVQEAQIPWPSTRTREEVDFLRRILPLPKTVQHLSLSGMPLELDTLERLVDTSPQLRSVSLSHLWLWGGRLDRFFRALVALPHLQSVRLEHLAHGATTRRFQTIRFQDTGVPTYPTDDPDDRIPDVWTRKGRAATQYPHHRLMAGRVLEHRWEWWDFVRRVTRSFGDRVEELRRL